MPIKPPPPPWDVLQHVGDFVGAQGVREEVDKNVRSLAQSAMTRLDLVSREEFDAQTALLRKTRARVIALEAQLKELNDALESREG